jgi:hypothetical protein
MLTWAVALSRNLNVPNLPELQNEVTAITKTIPEYWGLDDYPEDDDEYYLEKIDVWSNQVCHLLNELADSEDTGPLPPRQLK